MAVEILSGKDRTWVFNPNDSTVITLQELFTFEYDASNYLYNLPPKQQNLFWAGNFQVQPVQMTEGSTDTLLDPRAEFPESVPQKVDAHFNRLDNAQFRIKSIRFPTPSLDFEENKVLQTDLIKGVTIPREVSITWEEDVYRSIQLYHLNWLKAWYNRENDTFVSGVYAKIRNLDIVSFHYVNKSVYQSGEKQTAMTVPFPEPLLLISLRGLKPKTFGEFNFDYSNTGNDESLSLTYSVTKIHLSVNQELVAPDTDMLYKPYGNDSDKIEVEELTKRLKDAISLGGLII